MSNPLLTSIEHAVGGRDELARLMWAGRELTGDEAALAALHTLGLTDADIEQVIRDGDSG